MVPQIYNAQETQSKQESQTIKKTSKRRHVNEYSEVMRKEKPSTNPLRFYAPKPQKIFFSSQLKEEQVILLLRQHPITQLKQLVIAIVIFFMPFLIFNSNILSFLSLEFHIAFTIGWYLMLLGFIIESFLVWFFHVYIITDERIIDVDFLSLIYKNISSAKIDNIEDIAFTTEGFFASSIDYGSVKIQTAGEQREFEFENVPHPGKVSALINELLLEEEREKIEGRVN